MLEGRNIIINLSICMVFEKGLVFFLGGILNMVFFGEKIFYFMVENEIVKEILF